MTGVRRRPRPPRSRRARCRSSAPTSATDTSNLPQRRDDRPDIRTLGLQRPGVAGQEHVEDRGSGVHDRRLRADQHVALDRLVDPVMARSTSVPEALEVDHLQPARAASSVRGVLARDATWVFQDMPSAPPGRSRDGPDRQRRREQVERAAGEARRQVRLPCATPYGASVTTTSAQPALEELAGRAGCPPAQHDDLAAPPLDQPPRTGGPSQPAGRGARAVTDRVVLDPLALEPGLEERGVRLDVLAVELDPDAVVPVHQGLVDRGAAAGRAGRAR